MRNSACTALILIGLFTTIAHGQLPTPLYATAPSNYWQGYQTQAWNYNSSTIDRVVVDIGTIGLVREKPDSQVLAFDDNDEPNFNASSLQGPMHFGTKAMVDFRNVNSWFGGTDLQFGYFGINSLDETKRVDSTLVRSYFFRAFPLNPPTSADFTYSSNLYSGEANLKFAARNRLRPIAGLRYFKLEDTYSSVENTSGNQRILTSLVNNSLFGGQIGLEGDLWQNRRVNLYGFGKVAALHNEIDGSATAANAYREYSDSTYTTLVDAGTGANIRVVGPLSFRVGYRSLFASALALGIDQNGVIPILGGPGSVKWNSQHWHGIDMAAVFQF